MARPSQDQVGARLAEVARRYRRPWANQTKADRIKAVRRREVLKLLHDRHGQCLPDNAVSRDDLQILFELGLNGPDAMKLAPWAAPELENLMAAADANFGTWWNGKPAKLLGQRLEVTFDEKVRLALHHIACFDKPAHVVKDHYRGRKRERDRERQRRRRAKPTAVPEDAVAAPLAHPQPSSGGPPDTWDILHDMGSRAGSVHCALPRHEWTSVRAIADFVRLHFAFKGLEGRALQNAVRRTVRRLVRVGLAELEAGFGPHREKVLLARVAMTPEQREQELSEQEMLDEVARDQLDTEAQDG
jgi:hypothetical protein